MRPASPRVASLLAHLEQTRSRSFARQSLANGTYCVERVTFRRTNPAIEVDVTLLGGKEERTALRLEPFRKGQPLEVEGDGSHADILCAVESAILLLRGPSDPEHCALDSWRSSLAWSEALSKLDAVLGRQDKRHAYHASDDPPARQG